GISESVRLAAVNPAAVFHNRPEPPLCSGSPAFGTCDAARSTICEAASSATLPAVPKTSVASWVRPQGESTSITEAAADALDAMNMTGIQRRDACQTGRTEFDTSTPVYPARAAPKIPAT